MVERFVYSTGLISIDTGDSLVVGDGTAWGNHDWAGAGLWAIPSESPVPSPLSPPIRVGTIAEVTPRGEYEMLELPLVSPYMGDPIVDSSYELVDGPAIANSTTQAAIYARFARQLEQNMGLVGNLADEDDIDWALVPNNTLFPDPVTRKLFQWREGILEEISVVGTPFNPQGPWVLAGERASLTIESGDFVPVDLGDESGLLFELTFDGDFTLQLPENASLNDTYDILFTVNVDSPTPVPAFDTGFAGVAASNIRTGPDERTQLRFTVTGVDSGIVTEVTVSQITYSENALIVDRDYAYVSNVDSNFAEPQIDESLIGVSDANWSVLPLPPGDPGAAVVVATSATSLSISAASKVFTLAEATERGFAIGVRLRAASLADPAVDWMEGVVIAYAHPTLTVLMDLVDAGSGTHADWSISLTGEPGPAGGGLANVVDDTTPQAGGPFDMNSKQMRYSKGADLASPAGGALTLGADGNYFDVTGTNAITSFVAVQVGFQFKLQFDAALVLTHHATDLVIPGGADITTAAGDHAEFVEYAAGDVRLTSYTKANGTPLFVQQGTTAIVGGFEKATNAEVRAATADKAITGDLIETASAGVALTDAAPVAVDWDAGFFFTLTTTADRQIGNPTNGQPGTYRSILVQGNNSTNRIITFGNQFLGDIPVITDCDDTKWYDLTIKCITTTHFTVVSHVAKKP